MRLLRALWRLAFRLLGRDWRDHSSLTNQLYGGRVTMAASGRDRYFQVTVAIAPSTRLSSRRVVRLPTPQAWALVDAARPAMFGERPAFSSGDAVIYESPGLGEQADRRYRAEIWRTGLVAFRDPLTMESDSDDPTLDLGEVALLLRNVAIAVRRGYYASLLGGRLSRLRRVDWFVAVTPNIVTDNGQQDWSRLECPGAEELSESADPVRWVPLGGYGARSLRGVPQRLKPAKLVRAVLDDLLRYCGYYHYDKVIDLVISALDQRVEPARSGEAG